MLTPLARLKPGFVRSFSRTTVLTVQELLGNEIDHRDVFIILGPITYIEEFKIKLTRVLCSHGIIWVGTLTPSVIDVIHE